MPTASIVYLSPKPQTLRNVWALRIVAGQTVLEHLLGRLAVDLPEHPIRVVFHDPHLELLLIRAAARFPARIFCASTRTQLGALVELSRHHNDISTVALFPEGSFSPDSGITKRMLRLHGRNGADATFAPELPLGFAPVVLSTAALQRLSEFDLPIPAGADCLTLLSTASKVVKIDGAPAFRMQAFGLDGDDIAVERLPLSFAVTDRFTLEAAERLLSGSQGATTPVEQAYHFKKLLDEQIPNFQPHGTKRSPAKRPIRVLIACCVAGLSGGEVSLLEFLAALDREQVNPLVIVPTESAFSESARALGVPTINTDVDFRRFDSRIFALLESILTEHQIDLVHFNGPVSPPLLSLALFRRLPTIFHVRSVSALRISGYLTLVDKIVVPTSDCLRQVQRAELRPGSIVRIDNGINLDRYMEPGGRGNSSGSGSSDSSGKFVASMLARITPEKRQHLFLDAASFLQSTIPNLSVFLAGEDDVEEPDYAGRLRRRIASESKDSIRICGFVEDPREIYARSDAIVSCNPNETFGRSIVEAMAFGVPVVAAAAGGTGELIEHGVDGLLFEPDNARALAECLGQLFSDSSLRAQLQKNGRRKAARFDINTHALRVLELYSSLMQSAAEPGLRSPYAV